MKEKPQETAPSQPALQEKKTPPLPGPQAPEETTVDALKRIQRDFKERRERIEQLAPKMQEEMRKMLAPQEKK